MIKKIVLAIFVLLAVLFFTGCFNLVIEQDVDYPADRFQQAMKKINRLHVQYPDRKGKVTNMNFLVYVGDERKLVSFSIPIETTKQLVNLAELGKNMEMEEYSDIIKDVDINLEKLKDLGSLGPGLLLEAEVTEDNDNVHLLIWLD